MSAMGGKNSELQQPANHFPEDDPAPEPDDSGDRSAILAHADALLQDTTARMVRRLAGSAKRAAKNREHFAEWIASCDAEHRAVLLDTLGPVCELMTAAGEERNAGQLADVIFRTFRTRANAAQESPGDLVERVRAMATEIENDWNPQA